jgi:hypothetical protein
MGANSFVEFITAVQVCDAGNDDRITSAGNKISLVNSTAFGKLSSMK